MLQQDVQASFRHFPIFLFLNMIKSSYTVCYTTAFPDCELLFMFCMHPYAHHIYVLNVCLALAFSYEKEGQLRRLKRRHVFKNVKKIG